MLKHSLKLLFAKMMLDGTVDTNGAEGNNSFNVMFGANDWIALNSLNHGQDKQSCTSALALDLPLIVRVEQDPVHGHVKTRVWFTNTRGAHHYPSCTRSRFFFLNLDDHAHLQWSGPPSICGFALSTALSLYHDFPLFQLLFCCSLFWFWFIRFSFVFVGLDDRQSS